MKTIYLVKRNSDTTEGRGPMVIDTAFFSRIEAAKYIDPKPGIMGRLSDKGWSTEKYGDWMIEPLIVYDSLTESNNNSREKLIESAMAKLTDSERIALGVDK